MFLLHFALCVHHFIIDSSNLGECKYCEEVRQFPSSADIDSIHGHYPGSVIIKPGKIIVGQEGKKVASSKDADKRAFKCDVCKKKFKTAGGLGSHMVGKHQIGGKHPDFPEEDKGTLLEFGPEQYCQEKGIKNPQKKSSITSLYNKLMGKREKPEEDKPTPPAEDVTQYLKCTITAGKDVREVLKDLTDMASKYGDQDFLIERAYKS